MQDSHSQSSLVVYACRLCGHIVSATFGPNETRPDRCPDCQIDAAFVPVDVISDAEQLASSE